MPIAEGFTDIDRTTVDLSEAPWQPPPAAGIFGTSAPNMDFITYKRRQYRALSPSFEPQRLRSSYIFAPTNGELLVRDDGRDRRWRCVPCKLKRQTTHYDAASTTHAKTHLQDVHKIGKDTEPGTVASQATVLEQQEAASSRGGENNSVSSMAFTITKSRFKDSLLDWILRCNVPFQQIENVFLQSFLVLLNPTANTLLPTRNTLRA